MIKHAILFLSDKSSRWILDNFNSILSVENESYEVFFLYHERNQTIPDSILELNYFSFTSDVLYELGYKPLNKSLIPGNNHFPLLKFYLENSHYDYYWMIEDDVCFTGNWEDLFKAYEGEEIDFISTHIKRYIENLSWFWWNTLHTNHAEISKRERICSFNPIYRLSNKALRCIDCALKEGWSGHHEVLIPSLLFSRGYSLADMGGTGSFVKTGDENRFYTNDTLSHLPLQLGNKANYIYHPVKEKKTIGLNRLKKNCIIGTIGQNSLHREWIKETPDFDLHLIIYDNSYNKFYNDTDFITYQKGDKYKLIYNYLQNYPEYLERYDYFFLPDDDILIDTENISKLFRLMQKFDLQIAQPALSDSYYSYEHTLRDRFCKLRYTNFVEMMLPCFSRKALQKVLPTFNEGKTGWGIEFHWSQLIGFTGIEIAVIDDLYASHTRPVQSCNSESMSELSEYIKKNDLNREITETNFIPAVNLQISSSHNLITCRKTHLPLLKIADCIAMHLLQSILNSVNYPLGFGGLTGISLFFVNYYRLSEKRLFLDVGLFFTDQLIDRAKFLKKHENFKCGLSGCSWYIEYLAQHGFVENNTDEVLKDICKYFNMHRFESIDFCESLSFTGIMEHYLIRMTNPNFDPNNELNRIEKEILTKIIHKIDEWSEGLSVAERSSNSQNLAKLILLLCQTKKVLPLPELDSALSKLTELFDPILLKSRLPYLQSAYIMLLASDAMGNKSLWDKTIQDIIKYKKYRKDSGFSKLINLYLLHRIYLLTHKEIFRTQALETLHIFINKYNNGTSFLNRARAGDLISSGLILSSVLSEKDLEFDSCILF